MAGGRDCLCLPVKRAAKEDAGQAPRPGPVGRAAEAVLHSTPLRLLVLAAYAGVFCLCAAGIPEVGLVATSPTA